MSEAPPLHHALHAAGALLSFSAFPSLGLILSTVAV